MKTSKILVISVLALMLCPTKIAQAEPIGTAFTYQGRLIDANTAADGLYDFQFKLYDDPCTGSQINGTITKNDVDVIDGYFTVELDFGNVFAGDARWLEICVRPGDSEERCTTLSPRQEVTPTPYALYAASGPGVPVPLVLSGSDSGALIKATNMGSGDGVQGETWSSSGRGVEGWALYSGPGANYGGYFRAEGSGGYGVYGYASNNGSYENYGGYFQADGDSGRGVYGFVTGDNGYAVQGMAFDSGDVTNYGGYFQARGASGRGVYGEASKTGAVENYGGYFTAAGENGRGVYGYASNTGGGHTTPNYGGYFEAAGPFGRGVYGYASNNIGSANNHGVYGEAAGTYGRGVTGYASSTSGLNFGGSFTAAGTSARAVSGQATNPGSGTNYGGFFTAASEDGRGVYGVATAIGPGTNINYGGYFEAASLKGRGVYGHATATGSANNYGVYGQADGAFGRGVCGVASATSSLNWGGYFSAAGNSGRGVYGEATNSGSGTNYGGFFKASGENGTGVYGWGKAYDFYAANPVSVNYGSASSIRWKSNIRAINDPLGKVLRLRGVYFNWDAEHGGQHDVGMIAEEVGQVLPEIVGYEEDGIYTTGMDYSKLTPLLVEAVKALKREADEQEKQQAEKDFIIERLQEQNQALSKRLAAVESLLERLLQQRKELNNETL